MICLSKCFDRMPKTERQAQLGCKVTPLAPKLPPSHVFPLPRLRVANRLSCIQTQIAAARCFSPHSSHHLLHPKWRPSALLYPRCSRESSRRLQSPSSLSESNAASRGRGRFHSQHTSFCSADALLRSGYKATSGSATNVAKA